jgi:ubiquinone/menaquinone biosynthesis C-methylase UbiE
MRRELSTTRKWRVAARVDPHYAVATWPGKRARWEEAALYETGATDWSSCLRHWTDYEKGLHGVCVEVGCGVGRMTRPLASSFAEVVGLDVSQEMIDLARANTPDNASFHVVDGTEIPLADGTVDAVFSCFVLEHLPGSKYVQEYFREMFRALSPRGTVMIQLALRRDRQLEGARTGIRRLRWWLRRRAMMAGRPVVGFTGREYTREQIRTWLELTGFTDIELREFRLTSNAHLVEFWLARKPQ